MAPGVTGKSGVDKEPPSPPDETPNSMVADDKIQSASPTDTGSSLSLPGAPIPRTAPKSKRWRDSVCQLWGWIPPPARYDPNNPPKFTVWINLLFAFAGCFTVSNLYYNQAVLNKIAETFNVSFEKASSVATLMQAGYASGLLFICPLGDVFPRRPFIIGLVFFTTALWIILCLTTSFPLFATISFLCGLTTVTPQILLPLVGDLAPPHRRASSLAIVVSGLSLGILVARILAGALATTSSWRNIYWFGLGAQSLVVLSLYIYLPAYPSKNPSGLNYLGMLLTVGHLLVSEPLLLQAALVAFCLSATFTSFWTTLSFLLASPPYAYPPLVVGLFGLIGLVVILLAPVYSRLVIDRFVPLFSAILGLAFELCGLVVGTAIGSWCVAGPIVQALTIDVGAQFTQIANRAAVYAIRPDARNRVNTAYMVASFSGQLTGTAVGNRLYAQGGWVYSGSASIGFVVFALVVCFVRGPRETGWFGWGGGWAIKRDDLPEEGEETLTEKSLEEAAGVDGGGKGEKKEMTAST